MYLLPKSLLNLRTEKRGYRRNTNDLWSKSSEHSECARVLSAEAIILRVPKAFTTARSNKALLATK